MAKGVTYVVYALPVILSIILGSIVMIDILQDPGRELNLLRFGSFEHISDDESLEILGLNKQYSVLEPIQIQVKVADLSFSCGDLYVTINEIGKEDTVTQSGYFLQCFDAPDMLLPANEKFSEIIDIPGKYELVVKMLDKTQKNSITTSEEFTVK